MKLKKTTFMILLFVLSAAILFTTENRVRALTGKGGEGAKLVADSWCDPFYISPSMATLYDNFFIKLNSNFGLDLTEAAGDEPHGGLRFQLNGIYNTGLFLPHKRFRFALDFSIIDYYTDGSLRKNNQYNYNQLRLGGELLFAWQLNKALSFGFLLGGKGLVYDNYKYKTQSYLPGVGPMELEIIMDPLTDFSLKENIGLTIRRKRAAVSFALPFKFSYNEEDNGSKTQFDTDKVLYRTALSNFEGGLHFLGDFRVKDSFGLRLAVDLKLGAELYSGRDEPVKSPVPGKSLDYKQFIFKGNTTLTFNHHLAKRQHHLFYGLSLTKELYYGRGESTLYLITDKLESDINTFELALYFGGEMKPLKRLNILFGLNAAIFRYEQYRFDNYLYSYGYLPGWIEVSRGSNSYSESSTTINAPLKVDLNFGLEIIPVNGFTIELNTGLVKLSPFYSKRQTTYPPGDTRVNNTLEKKGVSLTFDLGFVWDISVLKRRGK